MNLHLHGQQLCNDDITIIGGEKALTHLQNLITAAKTKLDLARSQHKEDQSIDVIGFSDNASPDDESFLTSDGEGYFANVVCLPEDDNRWNKLAMPYHDVDHHQIDNNELVWTHKGFVEYGSFTKGERPLSMEAQIANWLLSGETGSSSKTMAAMALGSTMSKGYTPGDVGDFSRCVKLVRQAPSVISVLRKRIDTEGTLPIPNFVALVTHWGKMVELYTAVWGDGKNQFYEEYRKLPEFKHLFEMVQLINSGAKAEDDIFAIAVQNVSNADEKLYADTKAKEESEAKAKADYDSLPAIKKRPKLDDSIITKGANDFIDQYENWQDFREQFVECMIANWDHDSGYQLAKKMEADSWSISDSELDELESVSYYIDDAYKEAQSKWLTENAIEAPYSVGTHVKFTHDHQELSGVIKAIEFYYNIGQYVITVDDYFNYDNGCPIVNWEDVEETGFVVVKLAMPTAEEQEKSLSEISISLKSAEE
jgi:hypothetical protein